MKSENKESRLIGDPPERREKILVVDDEESIREAMDEFLKGEGYEVSLAENGSEALEMFEENEYDIVFMDIKMPGIDGIKTLKEMKKSKPKVKVIIITGLPDEETFERAMAVTEGTVEGFVAKPFKPDDLRKVLDEVKIGKVLSSFGLTQVQQNALLKIGKLGAESASKALSQILKREIEITIQETTIFSIEDILTPAKESKEMAAGLLLKCSGNISGRMLVLIPWDSALDLADLLEKKELGTTKSFNESTQMLLQSVANVLATSYLNATGKVLNLSSSASIERLFFDNRANVLKEAVKESAMTEHILVIVTEFIVRDTNIKGKILLLPDIDSLKVIFKQAGAFK